MARCFLHEIALPAVVGALAAVTWLAMAGCAGSARPPGAAPAAHESAAPAAPESAAPAAPESAAPAAHESAAPAAPAEVAARRFEALSPADVERQVKPWLEPGERLAHTVYRGPLAPGPDTLLAVVNRRGRVAAFALVQPAPGSATETWTRVNLPGLDAGLLDSVSAVIFIHADGRDHPAAVIMTRQMTGAGPQGAIPRPFNLIIGWQGEAFVRLETLEERVFDLESAAEIEQALTPARPPG